MKLATLKDSTRDGRLVVVSKDLTRCSEVGHIARTLQAALDDWAYVAPRLERVAEGVETGSQPTMRFHEHDAASPLPRAFGCGFGGTFAAPRDDLSLTSGKTTVEAYGVAVVNDLAAGSDAAAAGEAIALVMLATTVSVDGEHAETAFSPVAVTPDEIAGLALNLTVNGKAVTGEDEGGQGFAGAVAAQVKHRSLGAGTLVDLGTPSITTSLTAGDLLRLDAKDGTGHSIFGAIERKAS
ncbi:MULTISPECIES: fumarylacetoacetate hydrolase family protein [unclassified Rhizobium]|uniref:fumarylacetoacetate hydrolase family protein n=1 Tax=unclassified Rhizobium TaxID=2613769 RepID=UPI0006FF7BE4|nr:MULTISPECIES: fumarylacetoacetate hydrolase family protein [unclassified Rhizobium]KQV38487.1 hypothetical protein ASC86_09800 [Rhizobium sp. Root1212]KRD31139.1 hypothetical protein ASE37_09790 [Rhizobium sp. Root268]